MDFTNFWFPKKQGGNDPGDPIGQSLRFRGGQRLTSNTAVRPPGKFTLSVWCKAAWIGEGAIKDNKSIYGNGSSVTGYKITNPDSPGARLGCRNGSSMVSFNPDSFLRDPSAWYHFVIQNDNEQSTAFVNGVQQPDVIASFPATGQLVIGSGNPGSMDEGFQGYMADFYVIDGQTLEPTAFGRFNEFDVWVPVSPEGLTFGANGFHLDFADRTQIGRDVSGNDNHFTNHGFNFDLPATSDYDLMDDSPTQNWATYNPITGASTGYVAKTEKANLTLCGAAAITATEKPAGKTIYFEVSTGYISSNMTWGGWWNTIQIVNGQIFDIGFGSSSSPPSYIAGGGFAFDISSNVFANNADEGPVINTSLAANDIIGVTLSDTHITITVNGVASSGVNDLPLANAYENGMYLYGISASTSLSIENLDINFGQRPFVNAQPDGTVTLQTQNLPAAPIANGRDHFQAITGPGQGADGSVVPGQRPGSWSSYLTTDGTWGSDGPAQAFTGQANASTSAKLTGGSTANVTFEPPAFTFTDKVEVWTNSNARIYFNNDPSPKATGNNSFQEIATGGGTLEKIFYEHNSEAIHVNAIRVDGEILVDFSILAQAQNTFPNGLWWIKDRVNSNAHQLVDSVTNAAEGGNKATLTPRAGGGDGSGFVDYVSPAGDSVAWCWNYNASNPQENGFAITRYTGNGAGTQPHNLGAAPDMVIIGCRDDVTDTSTGMVVYFRNTGNANTYLRLSSNNQSADPATTSAGGILEATDTTITYTGATSNRSGCNENGRDYTMYLWNAIPGYSAFGSYTGNGDADGPFVYTGFKIGWLMWKATTRTGNWQIYDSTRTPSNPNDTWLESNETQSEQSNTVFSLDLLSNGFKLRGNGTFMNESGQTYIYCAFAENPFQSPVTAR